VEAGLSLKQILDLRGAISEEESRVIMKSTAFVLRLMYNHRSYPREFTPEHVLV